MKKRPNIIFVLTDDQGYGDLGCTGNPWIQTPHIDTLYAESIRMTNYHVGPTCAPTRAGLLTGHYANSTGVWHTIGGRSLLRKDEYTLATALAENGYATGIFGKWHLGDEYPYRPQDRGFQEVIIHGGGGISQTPDYWGNNYINDYYCMNGEWKQFNGYCTDVFFNEAINFIDSHNTAPFFCYIATNAPHEPYNVEDKYADLYRDKVEENRARFYGMITNIDENVGKLRSHLKDLGIDEQTIFIYMTDNGSSEDCCYNEAGEAIKGYNAGLRGMKNSEYDGGHRTPFFMYYPDGKVMGGKDCNELTANIDFMPTLLDFCDIAYDKERFHGVSIRKLFENVLEKVEERYVITDSQRLVQPLKWRKSAVMKDEWRLVNGKELYNLESDRLQRKDVAMQYPEIVEAMREAYEKWWKRISVRFEEPIPLYLEKGAKLTTHDWRGDENCAWNQGMIRRAVKTEGYWEVYAPQDAKYEIQFLRWCPSTGYSIRKGIEGADCDYIETFVPKEWRYLYVGGEALDIEKCQLLIDNQLLEEKVICSEDKSAVFNYFIKKGNHTLEGRFIFRDGTQMGTYYAEVVDVY